MPSVDSNLQLELSADSNITDAKFDQLSHFTIKLNNASLVPKLVIRNPVVSTKPAMDDGFEVFIVKSGNRFITIYEGREPRQIKRWLWKGSPALYHYEIDWKYLLPHDTEPVNQNEYENRQYGTYEVKVVLKDQGKKVLESNIILIEYTRE